MNSFLFLIASRLLRWPLGLFSLYLLYRGHNAPGGGFIGGLVGASALLLPVFAEADGTFRRALSTLPEKLLGWGLLLAVGSGLPGLLVGSFLEGLWLPAFSLPLLGVVHLGTPLLFDCGVYLTVAGFVLLVTFRFLQRP